MRKDFDDKKYLSYLKIKMKTFYDSVDYVYCPVLKKYIYFNSVGFRHLRYKPDGTPRKNKESIYKLKLLPLVISVIRKSTKIEQKREVLFRTKRGKKFKLKKAVTYSLVAKVGRRSILVRVIIIKIGDGKHVFYSVMKDK